MKLHPFFFAAILGTIQATLWAVQHPLEDLFYRQIGQTANGLLEGVFYSKMLALMFAALLLFVPGVWTNLAIIIKERTPLKHIVFGVFLGYISLGLYAFGQSRLDGSVVSIIIAASPLSYHIALDYFRKKGLPFKSRLSNFLKSRHIHVHILLSVIVIYFLSKNLNYAETNSSILAMIAIFFVPAFFFAAYIALGDASQKIDHVSKEHRRASTSAVAFSSAVVSSLFFTPLVFCYFTFVGHNIAPATIPMEYWLLFVISAFLAGFVAHYFHFWNFTRTDEKVMKDASLFLHLTPVITTLIAFTLSIFVVTEMNITTSYFWLGLAVTCVIIFSRKYIKEKK